MESTSRETGLAAGAADQRPGAGVLPDNVPAFLIKDMQLSPHSNWLKVCGRSIQVLMNTADRFALAPDPIMIIGECGTGKHQVAQHIHAKCVRSSSRFIRVSCGKLGSALAADTSVAAWCELLLEFGRNPDVIWLFDRVDEIPISQQHFLSGFVEDILRSGDTHRCPRVISTSRPGLEAALVEGRFREDLFYKLNVLELTIPPLRERKEDIPKLVDYFLAIASGSCKRELKLTPQAVTLLCEYQWPGNVVELRNVISKLTVLCESGMVDSEELLRHWRPAKRASQSDLIGLKLEDAETHLILEAVARCHGNKTAAAKQLGITPRTLHNKMQKYRRMGFVE